MKNRVETKIDGKTFMLVGEETEYHLQHVAEYIDEKVREVRKKAAAVKVDSNMAYILAAINVVDDLFKEKEKCAELEGRIVGMTVRQESTKGLVELLQEKLLLAEKKIETLEERLAEKAADEEELLRRNQQSLFAEVEDVTTSAVVAEKVEATHTPTTRPQSNSMAHTRSKHKKRR